MAESTLLPSEQTLHAPIRMRFPAPKGAPLGSTGSAAESAFPFQGRWFVRVLGAGGNQRANPKAYRPEARQTERCDGNVVYEASAPTAVSVEDSRHSHKAPFCRQGAATLANGPMSGPHPCTDAAHDPSGAALCRDRSEPALRPTMRLTHERVPGSTNAPPQARSRPDLCFPLYRTGWSNHDVGSYGVNHAREKPDERA